MRFEGRILFWKKNIEWRGDTVWVDNINVVFFFLNKYCNMVLVPFRLRPLTAKGIFQCKILHSS